MRFDASVSLGNLIALVGFIVAAFTAWRAWISSQRDLDWRIKNLETWRLEHMVDEDARDSIIRKLDKVMDFIERELRLRNIKWIRDKRIDE